jgi:hypothetical protein
MVGIAGAPELRDPYWPLHPAKALGTDVTWLVPYQRAKG